MVTYMHGMTPHAWSLSFTANVNCVDGNIFENYQNKDYDTRIFGCGFLSLDKCNVCLEVYVDLRVQLHLNLTFNCELVVAAYMKHALILPSIFCFN